MTSSDLTPIPFNRPATVGREFDYIAQAIANDHTSAGGPFTERVSTLLRSALNAEDVVLTTSCTDALELAALVLGLGPGDTVIVPSFTFVSTASAFARTGANIRFADIESATFGLDPTSVESLLDHTVRAIVPVHYGGVGCDIAGLGEIVSGSKELDEPPAVVEDNAHGLFGAIGNEPLGSFGRMSTLSFHETKNFVCGEGGALVLNDARDIERVHILLDKGTNRREFSLGLADKYTWVALGSSFGLSDMLAAHLLAQLEERNQVLARRREVWERYDTMLRPHAETHHFSLMSIPVDRTSAWHNYVVVLPTRQRRDAVIAALASKGITATFHYVPLHSSPEGQRRTDRPGLDCPVTDEISGRLVRLPFYNTLTLGDQERVAFELLSSLE